MEFSATIKCLLCHGRQPFRKKSYGEMEVHLKEQHWVIFFMKDLIKFTKCAKNEEDLLASQVIDVDDHVKEEDELEVHSNANIVLEDVDYCNNKQNDANYEISALEVNEILNIRDTIIYDNLNVGTIALNMQSNYDIEDQTITINRDEHNEVNDKSDKNETISIQFGNNCDLSDKSILDFSPGLKFNDSLNNENKVKVATDDIFNCDSMNISDESLEMSKTLLQNGSDTKVYHKYSEIPQVSCDSINNYSKITTEFISNENSDNCNSSYMQSLLSSNGESSDMPINNLKNIRGFGVWSSNHEPKKKRKTPFEDAQCSLEGTVNNNSNKNVKTKMKSKTSKNDLNKSTNKNIAEDNTRSFKKVGKVEWRCTFNNCQFVTNEEFLETRRAALHLFFSHGLQIDSINHQREHFHKI